MNINLKENNTYILSRLALKTITVFKVLLIGFLYGTNEQYGIQVYVMAISNGLILPLSDIAGIIFSQKSTNSKNESLKKFYNLAFPTINLLVIFLAIISLIVCSLRKDLFNISNSYLIFLVILYALNGYLNIIRCVFGTFYWSSFGIRKFTIKLIYSNLIGLIIFLSFVKITILAFPLSMIFNELALILLTGKNKTLGIVFKYKKNIMSLKISLKYMSRFLFPLISNILVIIFTLSEQMIATSVSISFLAIISYTNIIINNLDSIFGFAEKCLSLVSTKKTNQLPRIFKIRYFLFSMFIILFLFLGFLSEQYSFNFGSLNSKDLNSIFILSALIVPSIFLTIQQSILTRTNILKKRGVYSFFATFFVLLICFFYSYRINNLAIYSPLLFYAALHYIHNYGRLIGEYYVFRKFSKYFFFDNKAHM